MYKRQVITLAPILTYAMAIILKMDRIHWIRVVGIAAGVGGVWEQFSDTISYNPLPFAAAAIGPGAAKPFLKSNKTLDLTNSLKSIWRKGHEGRVKKFQNLNELDKRIAHLVKELTAAKAGGDAYMKFTGKKGVGGTSAGSPYFQYGLQDRRSYSGAGDWQLLRWSNLGKRRLRSLCARHFRSQRSTDGSDQRQHRSRGCLGVV